MRDYIKRGDAKTAICSSCANPCSLVEKANSPCVTIIELARIPSADVAPVRHGRWIEYGENKDGTHNIHCPVCDAGFKSKGHANSYYTKHKYRYCPNCGAKMDEGENDA